MCHSKSWSIYTVTHPKAKFHEASARSPLSELYLKFCSHTDPCRAILHVILGPGIVPTMRIVQILNLQVVPRPSSVLCQFETAFLPQHDAGISLLWVVRTVIC